MLSKPPERKLRCDKFICAFDRLEKKRGVRMIAKR